MPKYIKSRDVQGIDYVLVDGVSYQRTGSFLPISSTTTTPLSDITAMYVSSCSAADKGQFNLSEGGTLTVPTGDGEFQMKFAGVSADDTGILVLDDNGSTCNVLLSVNATDNLVWDAGAAPTGTPNGYEFTNYPHTLSYTDCNSNIYDITLAGLGSFLITVKPTGVPATSYVYTFLGNAGETASVDACFTSSCPGWSPVDSKHHFTGAVGGGDIIDQANIYAVSTNDGNVSFTLSVGGYLTQGETLSTATFEAQTGATVCSDCLMLSAHSFNIAGDTTTATGTFSSSNSQWYGTAYAVPPAGMGQSSYSLSLVLSVTGIGTTLPINQTTGLDANGVRVLYDIEFSGINYDWTLAEYSR